jgi:hypothetical protein
MVGKRAKFAKLGGCLRSLALQLVARHTTASPNGADKNQIDSRRHCCCPTPPTPLQLHSQNHHYQKRILMNAITTTTPTLTTQIFIQARALVNCPATAIKIIVKLFGFYPEESFKSNTLNSFFFLFVRRINNHPLPELKWIKKNANRRSFL